MQSKDVWTMLLFITIIAFVAYAGYVGVNYNDSETPIDSIIKSLSAVEPNNHPLPAPRPASSKVQSKTPDEKNTSSNKTQKPAVTSPSVKKEIEQKNTPASPTVF